MISLSAAIISAHKDTAMRFARALRESHNIDIKPAIALEVLARAMGCPDWATLTARTIQAEPHMLAL
jgi:hypothetical protein